MSTVVQANRAQFISAGARESEQRSQSSMGFTTAPLHSLDHGYLPAGSAQNLRQMAKHASVDLPKGGSRGVEVGARPKHASLQKMRAQAQRPFKVSYKKNVSSDAGRSGYESQDVLCAGVNLSPHGSLAESGKPQATPDLPRAPRIVHGGQAIADSRPHTQQHTMKPKSIRLAARLLDRRQEQQLAEQSSLGASKAGGAGSTQPVKSIIRRAGNAGIDSRQGAQSALSNAMSHTRAVSFQQAHQHAAEGARPAIVIDTVDHSATHRRE